MLVVFACVYTLMKLLQSLPTGSDEAILAGMMIIGFVGVPVFFGALMAVIGICLWMASGDGR
jgi:hypothetical protein